MSTNPFLNEEEFLDAIENDSPLAAAHLYDTYAATLYKIICLHTRDAGQAAEILEQTMQTIWKTIPGYRQQDHRFLIWIAGVARKLAKQNAVSTTIIYTLRDLEDPGEGTPLTAFV